MNFRAERCWHLEWYFLGAWMSDIYEGSALGVLSLEIGLVEIRSRLNFQFACVNLGLD